MIRGGRTDGGRRKERRRGRECEADAGVGGADVWRCGGVTGASFPFFFFFNSCNRERDRDWAWYDCRVLETKNTRHRHHYHPHIMKKIVMKVSFSFGMSYKPLNVLFKHLHLKFVS